MSAMDDMSRMPVFGEIGWMTRPAEFEADGDGVLVIGFSGPVQVVNRVSWDTLEASVENAIAALQARGRMLDIQRK